MKFRISKKARAVVAVLLVLCTTVSLVSYAAPAAEDTVKIQRFERLNPVYWAYVEPGTALEDTGLPETLRAVFDLSEFGLDAEDFVQAEPAADMSDGYPMYDYYSYGYVRPDNSAELYAAGETAVYSVYYEDPEDPGTVGEIEYRVYGSIGDYDPCWFTCDEEGSIDGVIQTVEVTDWDGKYDAETEGTYTLTADLPGDFCYDGDNPNAEITVAESSGSEDECEDVNSVESSDSLDEYAAEPEEIEPEEVEEETEDPVNAIVPLLSEGGGSNNATMYDMMKNFMPTVLERQPGDTSSSSWTEYINTIWWNKGFLEYEWTTDFSGTSVQQVDGNYWAWSGVEASSTSGTVRDNANRIPEAGNGVWEVYSGEQLRYALTHYEAGDTVRLMADIDLNGMNYNWEGIYLTTSRGAVQDSSVEANDYNGGTSRKLIFDGNNHTIYNFGQVDGVGFFSEYGELTIENLDFTTACVVLTTRQDGTGTTRTYAGIIGHTSNNGADGYDGSRTTYQTSCKTKTFTNVDVNDSLIAALGSKGETEAAYDCYVSPFTAWSSNVYRTGYGRGGTLSTPVAKQEKVHSVTNCSVNDCYVYGSNHVNGFSAGASQSDVTDCFSQGNLICGTGKHSAGFVSCNVIYSTFTNCFAANEFYGTEDVAGFVALSACSEFENCYSTGKVEGYHNIAGFVVSVGNQDECGQSYINNCYSTALVSLRSSDVGGQYQVHDQAGFYAQSQYIQSDLYSMYTTVYQITNSYAAGEVGNYDTDDTKENTTVSDFTDSIDGATSGTTEAAGHTYTRTPHIGGFISSYSGLQTVSTVHGAAPYSTVGSSNVWTSFSGRTGNNTDSFSYCYYDKQTTAMREWVAGDINTNVDEYGTYNYGGMTSLSGVTGVLTSDTEKGGTGLAGGSYGTGSDVGFTGFSNNGSWVYSDDAGGVSGDYYPQLSVFYNPDSGWGDKADIVKAYSLASTSTVFLDTWDSGYTWDNTGVRSAEKTDYNTDYESSYRGYKYTYDTVRDIISDFTATGDGNEYTYMINPTTHGAYTSIKQTEHAQHKDGVGERASDNYLGSVEIENDSNASYIGTVNEPGVEWFKISRTVNGSTGYRPIRLIAYMHINAGTDQYLESGAYYDHRDDVRMSVMYSLEDNLVVGWNDSNDWANVRTGGYPLTGEASQVNPDEYEYGAVLVDNLNPYSYSGETKIWTEVWVAKAADNDSGDTQPTASGEMPLNIVDGSGADDARVYTAENGDLWEEYYSVYVNGSKADESLDEEKTWIGELPHDSTSDGCGTTTYIVSYYWMLEDGRYINDYKLITLEETHNIEINVRDYYSSDRNADYNGSLTNDLNGNALNIGLGVAENETTTLTDEEKNEFETLLEKQSRARTSAEQAEMEYLQNLIDMGNALTDEEAAILEELQAKGDPMTTEDLKRLGELWTQYNLYSGVSEETSSHEAKEEILSGTNVTFGWSQSEDSSEQYRVKKIQVDYNSTTSDSSAGDLLGSWSLDVKDITDVDSSGNKYVDLMSYLSDQKDGYSFTVTVNFEAVVYEMDDNDNMAGDWREELRDVTAKLTYKIVSDGNDGFTLTLDKFSCYLDDNYDKEIDDTTGIVILLQDGTDVTGYATLDDLFSDVTVTLWVAKTGEIPVYKIDSYGVPAGTENGSTLSSLENIKLLDGAVFSVYAEEDVTLNTDGTLTVNDGATPVSFGATADLTGKTDPDPALEVEDGLVIFDNLEESSVYYIVETSAPSGYELLSPNWWKITLGQNFMGDYLTYKVESGGSWYLYTETVTGEDGAVTSYTAAFIPNTRTSVMLYKIDGSDVVTDQTTGDVTDYTALGDASFYLSYTEGNVTYYYSGTAQNGELQWTEDVNEALPITSAEDGAIALPNLDPGTYQLQEVTAPDGYLVLSTPWDIVVDEHGGVTTSSEYSVSSDGVFIQMITSSSKNTYSVVYVTESDADEGIWTYTDENGNEQLLYMNPSDGLLYVNANFSGTGYEIMQPTVWYIPNYATYELPSAAGSGLPLICYFAGGMALMAAGAWIWLRRWKRGEVDLN